MGITFRGVSYALPKSVKARIRAFKEEQAGILANRISYYIRSADVKRIEIMARKTRKKGLLDMDGVVANFAQLVIQEYNSKYGTNLSVDQWTSFELSEAFGKDVWEKMEEIYNAPGFFAKIEPYPGAKEIIEEVMEDADLIVCTSPTKKLIKPGHKGINPHCVFEKVNWIHDHFPKLSEHICLFGKKELVKADFLVDDATFNNLNWCKAHPEGKTFMPSRLWNDTHKLHPNCTRAPLEKLPEFVRSLNG